MENKIGILTFHRALSYGANLQAYALQNYLFKLNKDNEIIDYECQYMVDHYQKTFRKVSGNKLRVFIWNLMTANTVRKKKKNTTEFVETQLKLSRPYNSENIKEIGNKYKSFITGSDQVWSPTCVGFDPVYFLTFAKPEQKHSYAASIATDSIPESIKTEYINRIKDFSCPSMREPSGAELVNRLTGKKARVDIDPSMLLTSDEWDKICSNKYPNEPYIFLFTVPKPSKLFEFTIELAREKNLKVLYLNNYLPKHHRDIIKYIEPVPTTEFISLIKHAEYVCTNSFHGNVFALLYHKNFVVETETATGAVNTRSRDLMQHLDLESRILSSASKLDIDHLTDWENIDLILEKDRKISENYLLSI